MSNLIILERFAYAPDGTFGKLLMPDGTDFFTVERPWLGNKEDESCIPEGVYTLGLRYSPIVESSTLGKFDEGWEILNVPERSLIMIHPGNWPFNFKGCIGLGYDYKIIPDRTGVPRNAVSNSVDAFTEFMKITMKQSTWDLDIRPKFIEYP